MSSEKQAEKLQTEMVKTGAALVPGADLHVLLSPDVEQELLGQLHELGIDAPQLDGVLTVVAQTISREVVHSGPLPPPQQLAAYNEVGEDFAERIVQMAEREQSHRHSIERRVVTASVQPIGRVCFAVCS